MSDKDKIEDIFDLFQTGMDVIDENEDKINRLLGGSNIIGVKDDDLLKEVIKDEDSVKIIAETKDDYDTVSIRKSGGQVELILDEENIVADIPSDSIVEEVEATINNRVLEVTIPREE